MGEYNITTGVWRVDDFDTIFKAMVDEFNVQYNTNYSYTQFEGSNAGKLLYLAAQHRQNLDNDVAQLGVKMADYLRTNNILLGNPPSTYNAVIDAFKKSGYILSVRPPSTTADAGKLQPVIERIDGVALSPSEYDDIAKIGLENIAGGIITEAPTAGLAGQHTLSNGQNFTFNFVIPIKNEIKIRAIIEYTVTSQAAFQDDARVKQKILDNFNEIYSTGNDIYGDYYLKYSDLPYARFIKVEAAIDANLSIFKGEIQQDTYNFKRVLTLANIEVTQTEVV